MRALSDIPFPTDLIRTVRCSDGVVRLDIDKDLYTALYAPRPSDAEGADAAIGYPSRAQPTIAWEEAAVPVVRPSLVELLRFARAFLGAMRDFRRLSFAELLEDARFRQLEPRLTRDDVAAVRNSQVFARLLRLLPIELSCLQRSYCLLRYLAACGQRAEWVFGVGLFPFAAHCWVARGSIVLAERADLVPRFSIILLIDGDYL